MHSCQILIRFESLFLIFLICDKYQIEQKMNFYKKSNNARRDGTLSMYKPQISIYKKPTWYFQLKCLTSCLKSRQPWRIIFQVSSDFHNFASFHIVKCVAHSFCECLYLKNDIQYQYL